MSTSMIPQSLPARKPYAHIPVSRARLTAGVRPALAEAPREDRSSSSLDEPHRRMRSNMQAIAALLHLDSISETESSTEALLTEMETRLQAKATRHRSLCRSGQFDQIDLAVYLRQAARLRDSPPKSPLPGGWIVEGPGLLAWADEGSDRHARCSSRGDLETALLSLAPRSRDLARCAIYACAIIAPPWIFRWRTRLTGPDGHARLSGPWQVSLRLQSGEHGVEVELAFSDRGPGLPDHFEARQQAALARDLTSTLTELTHGLGSHESARTPRFHLSFVPGPKAWIRQARDAA